MLFPHSTKQSLLMTLDPRVWKTDRRGDLAENLCICVISPFQIRALFFADKVLPNWQVIATVGDLFPRLPLGAHVCVCVCMCARMSVCACG